MPDIDADVDLLKRKVEKLDKVIFFGNGRPPLTEQLATINLKLNAIVWGLTILGGAMLLHLAQKWIGK